MFDIPRPVALELYEFERLAYRGLPITAEALQKDYLRMGYKKTRASLRSEVRKLNRIQKGGRE